MTGIIYKYTSPIGKAYIGQTIHHRTRYMRHKRMEGDSPFHRAISKYGFENFKYEIIAVVDLDNREELKDKLNWLECYYIKKYKSFYGGYNLTEGGEGGIGTKHTDEWKARASKRMKENNPASGMTDEWRYNIGESQKGKKMSDEFKGKTSARMKEHNPMKNPEVARRVSILNTGRKLTEEQKKKISSALKGRKINEDVKEKMSAAASKRKRDAYGHFIKNND